MKRTRIRLMEVCGTHTMAIARSGIKKLLPETIKLISGPGCPVCVTDQHDIDIALEIADTENVIMATFGDMLKVPGSRASLADMKARGRDVRVVYSCLDALDIAAANPSKNVVFIGVGFETTSPTVAATVIEAKKRKIKNFFILPYFKVIFPALEAIASSDNADIDGFLCPGHVSVITGSEPYEAIARRHKKPCVITGFEETDLMRGIRQLVEQVESGSHKVTIEYSRAVKKGGNAAARKALNTVFEETDSSWRGLGRIEKSGLKFKKKYAGFDASKRFKVNPPGPVKHTGCICGDVLQGISAPTDCKLFRRSCTPQYPIGPCMVSSEGTCAAHYKYGE